MKFDKTQPISGENFPSVTDINMETIEKWFISVTKLTSGGSCMSLYWQIRNECEAAATAAHVARVTAAQKTYDDNLNNAFENIRKCGLECLAACLPDGTDPDRGIPDWVAPHVECKATYPFSNNGDNTIKDYTPEKCASDGGIWTPPDAQTNDDGGSCCYYQDQRTSPDFPSCTTACVGCDSLWNVFKTIQQPAWAQQLRDTKKISADILAQDKKDCIIKARQAFLECDRCVKKNGPGAICLQTRPGASVLTSSVEDTIKQTVTISL